MEENSMLFLGKTHGIKTNDLKPVIQSRSPSMKSTRNQRKIACIVYFSISIIAAWLRQPIVFSITFVFGIVYLCKMREAQE